MKNKNLHLVLIMLLLAARPDFAFSRQNKQDTTGEKVVLITDRSIYIAGEQLQFSVTVIPGISTDAVFKSQVLYCELIAPDGNKISGGKYLISQTLATGCLPIPEEVLTGTYYLRAYTKQMRNFGPASYEYKQIRVVNPGRNEVLSRENEENGSGEKLIQANTNQFNDILSVSVEKNTYAARDTIKFSVQTAMSFPNIAGLSLSVVPEATTSNPMLLLFPKEKLRIETDYYPESRGLSLTGKLTEGPSRKPVMGKRINLSIIGEGRDFMAVRTDSSGRFFFALPDYTGSRDLFLCAEKTQLTDLKIWVDNDFCSLPVRLPSPVFSLSGLERQTVMNMAVNEQINSLFHRDTSVVIADVKQEDRAFYGNPANVLFLDQYVQLPTLEEYFNELPGLVKVRKRMGEKYFKVIGSRDLSFFDPLVLVDWVAVDEPSRILAVSPQNISRIEIVNDAYVKGGQTYGGIISIISKKGNFAGIDLPSTGIFINYRFLAENQCSDKDENANPGHPDVRNTILWKPDLHLKQGETEKFVIVAPDTPGRYLIVLEGMTTEGDKFLKTGEFTVGN